MVAIILGFAIPKYYDVFIPPQRRGEGTEPTLAMDTKGELAGQPTEETVKAEAGAQTGTYVPSSEDEPYRGHRGLKHVGAEYWKFVQRVYR